jgi:glutamyl-tRNA synthetase
MPENKIRVRFAPSPTGQLHIGSVRTALFNYLFAKANDGLIVLRIEDTDEKRSTDESLRTIIDGMKWLGLDWDEGPEKGGISEPYFQSERVALHREYAQKLIDEGKTYYCNCQTETEKGSCECAGKNQETIKSTGDGAVRYKIPPGITEVNDLIRGKVTFNNEDLRDFILLKANGNPVYNFAVVVDDITMGVTHIIRGEDHLSNTPKQILLYKALGVEPPIMAHLPLINSPLGGKLSKRQLLNQQNDPSSDKYVPAVNVEWYREQGFLPEAVVNYLARLGWSDGSDNEFFTLQQLETIFDIRGIVQTPALFDWKKLKWFNGMYIRNLSPDRFCDEIMPYFIKAHGDQVDSKPHDWIRMLLLLYQERVDYFAEIGDKTGFYFTRPTAYDPADVKKVKWTTEIRVYMKEFLIDICSKSDFSVENLEELSKEFAESRGLKLGAILQPVRLAVTGSRATPGLFEILHLIGKDESIERMKQFIDNVEVV